MKIRAIAALVAMLLVAAIAPASAKVEIVKSKNVKLLDDLKYTGGKELAASGRYVYASEMNGVTNRGEDPTKGGLHIFDVAGKAPKEVGFLHCPGEDNDVEVVKPGLVVMAFQSNVCAPAAGNGMMTIDVSNPRKPRILGMVNTGKSHTVKPVPGTNLVYNAGGAYVPSRNYGPAIVDVSNPRKPKVVKVYPTTTIDCHDISFHVSKGKRLGFCAGALNGTGETQIWDMTDPLEPVLLSRIVNPAIQYSHYAVANSDGTLLAIDDEAFAAHECGSGHSPTGRVWIYDITDPAMPMMVSSMAAPRGKPGVGHYVGQAGGYVPSWCLSHGLDWKPGTNNLGVTWFNGGWSVLNLDDPATPTEVAYFKAADSSTYSILWHEDSLYTNDSYRGMDAFSIKGLE